MEENAHLELFNLIKKLNPIIEIKELKKDKTTSITRKEYILINNTKINFENLKMYLDTIQKRYYLNNFCRYEIPKDCENKPLLTKIDKELLNKPIKPEFLIYCEYFIFSTKTIFDTILKIIREIYPKNNQRGFNEIDKWDNNDIIKSIIGNNIDWFIKFNKLRNNLTHDSIIDISTSLNQTREGEITYSKRNIKIDKELLQLPDYFEESTIKTNEIINNFYNWLLKQKIEDKYPLLILNKGYQQAH